MLERLKALLAGRRRVPAGTEARGPAGERAAARFLQAAHGYRIVARNWRNPRDGRQEIDLVCRDGPALVFVEVKTRPAWALVPGIYAINRRKRRALRRAIHAYLRQLRARPRTIRFDVTEVITGGAPDPTVLHFENVPLFGKYDHVDR